MKQDKIMLKRLCLVLVLGICGARAVQAQGAPIEVWVTSGVSTSHNKTFAQFAESFNTYNGSVVKTPLTSFGLGSATNWGVSFILGETRENEKGSFVDLGFFASNLHSKAQTTYTDDARRVFDLKRHQFGFEFGGGPQLGRATLSFTGGVLLGNSILNSYYIYADGTESHGQEKTWNGIFDGFNGSGFLSAKFGYRIGSFKVLARLSYGGDMFKKFYFSDHNTSRALNVEQGNWPAELPTDVVAYMASVIAIDTYDGGTVENRFGHLGIQVGIGYSFLK